MKKRGIVAFIVYLLGCLVAGVMMVWAYIEAQNIPENDVENWEGLGVAILILIGLIIGVPCAVRLVLKFIHMVSGWKLFGVACILADIVIILYWMGAHLIFGYSINHWIDNMLCVSGIIQIVLCAVPNVFAMISNIASIKE